MSRVQRMPWKLLNFCCTIVLSTHLAVHWAYCSAQFSLAPSHSTFHCTYFALRFTLPLEVSTVLRLFITAVDNPHTQQCSAQVQALYLRATAPLPLFPNFLRFRFPACPHFSPLPIYESWVKTQTSDIVPFVKRLIGI